MHDDGTLRCRPIVHITVSTEHPQRMNTTSIWRGRRKKEEKWSVVDAWEEKEDVEGIRR